MRKNASNKESYFTFCVSSVGPYGDAFAVAGGVYGVNGKKSDEFTLSIPLKTVSHTGRDESFIKKHFPALAVTHGNAAEMRNAFWRRWEQARDNGAVMLTNHGFPAAFKFLFQCVEDEPSRAESTPYPVMELNGILHSHGHNLALPWAPVLGEDDPRHPLQAARHIARVAMAVLAGKILDKFGSELAVGDRVIIGDKNAIVIELDPGETCQSIWGCVITVQTQGDIPIKQAAKSAEVILRDDVRIIDDLDGWCLLSYLPRLPKEGASCPVSHCEGNGATPECTLISDYHRTATVCPSCAIRVRSV